MLVLHLVLLSIRPPLIIRVVKLTTMKTEDMACPVADGRRRPGGARCERAIFPPAKNCTTPLPLELVCYINPFHSP